MSEFFEDMDPALAERLGGLYEELTNLKNQRLLLHNRFNVDSTEEILERIRKGEEEEHPAYDAYLALLNIEQEIERLREEIKKVMEEA